MIYTVTRKSDGVEVYRFDAPVLMELHGFEFATHDYAPVPEDGIVDVPVIAMTWTKLEYLRRFSQDERIAIRTAAKTVPQLEDYLALLELASEVRSDDPDIVAALAMLEAGKLIGVGRAKEILNG